jgi:hypothetical protein
LAPGTWTYFFPFALQIGTTAFLFVATCRLASGFQRHTGVLRWTPVPDASVSITRFDRALIREDHLSAGIKALLDALKVGPNGRRDGRRLFYFGAIFDDDVRSISLSWQQELVSTAKSTGMRIVVSPTRRRKA